MSTNDTERRVAALEAERAEALRLAQDPREPGMMRAQHAETAAMAGRAIARLKARKPRPGEVTPADEALGKAERHFLPAGRLGG